MKVENVPNWRSRLLACCLVGALFIGSSASAAITTNVSIACLDAFCSGGFTPMDVSIQVNDSVKWTWADSALHSTTSTAFPPLWDSGVTVAPKTFTNQFLNSGNFPYICTFHGWGGSVTVQAATSAPPSISILAPTNNATFAAPWTGAIQANVSDSSDTVSTVDFFAGTTHLGTVSNPPTAVSFTVSNLAAGNYTLKAVATASLGATNSASVSINVLTPGAITLSSPERLAPSGFRFNYTADPGLTYIVQRSGTVTSWLPISTNAASSSPVSFTDINATGATDFYRVQLAPNP